MSIKKFHSTVFILNLLILLWNNNIFSQEQEPADTTLPYYSLDTLYHEMDDVVITGTRVNKKIIDIPYPVFRINNTFYQYNRKLGVNDVLQSVPGMFLQSRYGNHDVRIAIRGFGSRSNSGIRGVRILLDNIPESEPDGQTRIEAIDFNSIGRIEIVIGNSSSLYTNAPGGVVNFINDMDFPRSFAVQFNQFGSFELRKNGIKAGIRSEGYGFLTTYSNQSYEGYREHNNENWNILNMVLETAPSENTRLKLLGYFVDGQIKLPGALTQKEFDEDPYRADQQFIDRDTKRISTKGRLGVRFNSKFGTTLNNEIEITTYGTIKYFERTSREYRIINRYGLGITARYVNQTQFGKHNNELSFGGDLLLQPARTEFYQNLSGEKGDNLSQLLDEKISNTGFYISDNLEILKEKLFVLITGRYDNIVYNLKDEIAQFRTGHRTFSGFTPKLAFNYKLSPFISVYTSYGLSFDSPAKNELDTFDQSELYNKDLEAQKSKNFELGIKGNVIDYDADFLRKILFGATFFTINIDNEIVPYEIGGEVFFRNAAKTTRTGLELGTELEIYRRLKFILSYTFSDFVYDSYVLDSTALTPTKQDFSGNIVPSVPEHNLYLSLSYAQPFSNNMNAFIRISYAGVSGLWVNDANTVKTDTYNILNTVLGYDIVLGDFNLMLSAGVNNMFDLVYVGFTNTNSFSQRFYEAGEPRNYYGSLNIGYKF